jgi:hypothetical protein
VRVKWETVGEWLEVGAIAGGAVHAARAFAVGEYALGWTALVATFLLVLWRLERYARRDAEDAERRAVARADLLQWRAETAEGAARTAAALSRIFHGLEPYGGKRDEK